MSLYPLVRATLVMDALPRHEYLACRSQGAGRESAPSSRGIEVDFHPATSRGRTAMHQDR
jgi:hypothetical protein